MKKCQVKSGRDSERHAQVKIVGRKYNSPCQKNGD
jgi:hypothetical protein